MGKHIKDRDEDEETLSFATMACHVSPSPENSPKSSPPGDPLFAFPTSPEHSRPSSPADVLFLNGRLVPNSLPPDTAEKDRRQCLKEAAEHRSGSRKLTTSASKRVSFQPVARTPPATDERETRHANNYSRLGHTAPSTDERAPREAKNYSGQGHTAPAKKKVKGRRGVLGFFMTTCRDCQALEPTSQVMEMRPLHACSVSTYDYGRKVNRPANSDV